MKRRPNTEDVLDWEELAQAPNTEGAFSFLRPVTQVIDIQDHRPPSSVPMIGSLDITSTVDVVSTAGLRVPRPYKVHRCKLAQDGHSQGENQLYGVLWNLGSQDGPESKLVRLGWISMGRKAGMSDKAAKRNIHGLLAKLSIEVIGPSDSATRRGQTYRLFSFKAILQRRQAAGLNYVIRDKGVRFVPDPSDEPTIPDRPQQKSITSTVDKPSTVDRSSMDTVDKTSMGTMDKTYMDAMDKTSMPLGTSLGSRGEITTTTGEELAAIVAALAKYVIADEVAASKIVSLSRRKCSTASVEEVVFAIHRKAPEAVRNRAIRNPLGLLIYAVPLCFEGSGLKQLRAELKADQERTARKEEARIEQELEWERHVSQTAEKLGALLKSPTATDRDKDKAVKELRQLAAMSNEPAEMLALCDAYQPRQEVA